MSQQTTTPLSRTNRSRLTNGSCLFLGNVDGRTVVGRRWRDLYRTLVDELGGDDAVSETHRLFCRRAATVAVLAEQEESRLALGEPVDALGYVRLTGQLLRILVRLGLEPDLGDGDDDAPRLSDLVAGGGAA